MVIEMVCGMMGFDGNQWRLISGGNSPKRAETFIEEGRRMIQLEMGFLGAITGTGGQPPATSRLAAW